MEENQTRFNSDLKKSPDQNKNIKLKNSRDGYIPPNDDLRCRYIKQEDLDVADKISNDWNINSNAVNSKWSIIRSLQLFSNIARLLASGAEQATSLRGSRLLPHG